MKLNYLTSLTIGFCFVFSNQIQAAELSPNSSRFQRALELSQQNRANAAAPSERARIRVKYRNAPRDGALAMDPSIERTITAESNASVDQVRSRVDGTQTIVLDRNVSDSALARIVDKLSQNPAVSWAVPETIERAQQYANDPRFGEQWHYFDAVSGIAAPRAWKTAKGAKVVIAVLDTGYRDHKDLQGKLLPGYDFVTSLNRSNDGNGRDNDATDPGDWCPSDTVPISSWHGTHVAGTAAAVTGNAEGVAGVAIDAKILPVRVLGRCGGSSFDIADGIRWAAGVSIVGVPDNPNPAQVINLSLGGSGSCSSDYKDAILQARQKGATIIVAAGNSNSNAANFRPANCDGVVTVAATNKKGGRAYFGSPTSGSNFGANVDISAPGGETYADSARGVLSTLNTGITKPEKDSYEAYQGTSMAAPHVAGIVALMYSIEPTLTPDKVEAALRATSRPFPIVNSRQCTTQICGAGIVDAAAAVEYVQKIAAQKAGTRIAAAPTPMPYRIKLEGLVDRAALWPIPATIPVCWEPTATAFTSEKQWVRDTVQEHIEKPADIHFTGWTVCRSNDLGIRIGIADEHPRSYVGRQFKRDNAGAKILDVWGRPKIIPTKMVLNFEYKKAFATCLTEKDLGKEHCIRAIGLHEFMHALGFLHEQWHPKVDSECKKKYGHSKDFKGYKPYPVGSYDNDSHVNYCADQFRKPIRLSSGDIAALKELYDVQ